MNPLRSALHQAADLIADALETPTTKRRARHRGPVKSSDVTVTDETRAAARQRLRKAGLVSVR